MGIGELFLAGSQQAIDYAWKQHTADLQRRQEAREQKKFDMGVAGMRANAQMQAGNAQDALALQRGLSGQPGAQAPGAAPAASQPGRVGGPASQSPQPTTVTTAGGTTITEGPTVPATPPALPAVPGTVPAQPARMSAADASEMSASPRIDNVIVEPVNTPAPEPMRSGEVRSEDPGRPTVSYNYGGADIPVQRTRGGGGGGGDTGGGGIGGNVPHEVAGDIMPMSSVPLELIEQAPEQPPVSQVPAPAAPTTPAVNMASGALAVQLENEQTTEQAKQEYVRNIYAERMVSLSERYASIANLAANGEVTFDIDSFTETYNAMSGVFNQILMQNGQLSALDATAIANGWMIAGMGSDGSLKYERADEETGLTYQFGMSRAQATLMEAAYEVAKEHGGFLPESYFNQHKEQLMHFPNMFQYQTVDGRPSQNIIVGEQGVLLSPDWHGIVNARLDAITTSTQARRYTADLLQQRREETAMLRQQEQEAKRQERALNYLRTTISSYRGDMDDAAAQRIATNIQNVYGMEVDPSAILADHDQMVIDSMDVADRDRVRYERQQAMQTARQQFTTNLARQRETWRDENTAQAQTFRQSMAETSAIRTTTGRGGRQVVDAGSYYAVQQPLQQYVEGISGYIEYDDKGYATGGLTPDAPIFMREVWPSIKNVITAYTKRDGGQGNMAVPSPANAQVLEQWRRQLARSLPNSAFARMTPPAAVAAKPTAATSALVPDAEIDPAVLAILQGR